MFSCCSPRKRKKKKNKQGKQQEPLEKEKAPLQKEEEQQREDGTQTQPPQVNTEKRGGHSDMYNHCPCIQRAFDRCLSWKRRR